MLLAAAPTLAKWVSEYAKARRGEWFVGSWWWKRGKLGGVAGRLTWSRGREEAASRGARGVEISGSVFERKKKNEGEIDRIKRCMAVQQKCELGMSGRQLEFWYGRAGETQLPPPLAPTSFRSGSRYARSMRPATWQLHLTSPTVLSFSNSMVFESSEDKNEDEK